ncbi:MAG: hypothetical protein ACKOE8_08870, partial [Opitutaceae bacterium]
MSGPARLFPLHRALSLLLPVFALIGCSSTKAPGPKPLFTPPPILDEPPRGAVFPEMLGIYLLEADGFTA